MANRWLVKTEPGSYSYDDLEREGRTVWEGVKNPAALGHLRAMAVGDEVLVYHTGDEKAVVGLAKVERAAYPDPKQKDPKRTVVDLAPVRRLGKPATLAALRARPELASWELLRISRLSVMPVPPDAWKAITALSKA